MLAAQIARGCLLLGDGFHHRFVTLLLAGETDEDLAEAGILGPLGGALIEAARFDLHHRRFLAGALGLQGAGEPGGPAHEEALDLLAPDERDVLTEPLVVGVEQPLPVAVLFAGYPVEQLGVGRKSVFSQLAKSR